MSETGLADLRLEHGWVGYFTRAEAPGAWPNGTRVVKARSEKGDSHKDGASGIVLGSIEMPAELAPEAGRWFYFVEWDDWRAEVKVHGYPRVAVGIQARKLARGGAA